MAIRSCCGGHFPSWGVATLVAVLIGVVKRLKTFTRPAISLSEGSDKLCRACSKVRFERPHPDLLYGTQQLLPLYAQVNLGSLSEVRRRKDCPLCRLVTLVLDKDRSLKQTEKPQQDCILRPANGSYSSESDNRNLCDVFYGGHPTSPVRGHILVAPALFDRNRRIVSLGSKYSTIDFDLIRQWLRVCESRHSSTCDQRPDRHGYRAAVDLTLIDTKEYRLVKSSTECRYLTLSYVWGEDQATFDMRKSNAQNFQKRHEPYSLRAEFHALPKVMQDAWKLTQQLNEQYLWIDALCIQQDDKDDLSRQLPLMDRVYNQSVLTVVALSGRHANESLPGMRPYERTPVTLVEYADAWIFTAEPPSLDWVLGLTKYEKRAWTLQERLLCKRRLFVSDWQVYFQCHQEIRQESHQHPRQLVQDPSHFDAFASTLIPLNISYTKLDRCTLLHVRDIEPWEMTTLQRHDLLVSELCRREMRGDEDILRAFAGVVSYLENLGTGPIVSGVPLSVIDRALLWAPIGRLQRRLIDGDDAFPSWSWVAWHGPIRHIWNYHGPLHELLGYDSRTIGSNISEFFIERDGKLERIKRQEQAADPAHGLPPAIAAEQYGMQSVGLLRTPVLHFLADTVPAAAFRFDGGRIRWSDFDGNWSFSLGIPAHLHIASMTNSPFGVFADIKPNLSGAHSSLYCQTEQDVHCESGRGRNDSYTDNDEYPITWILDQKGRECGILVDHNDKAGGTPTWLKKASHVPKEGGRRSPGADHEDVAEAGFQFNKLRLVLLSQSSTVPESAKQHQKKVSSRGQRVMLTNLPKTQNDWGIMNLLLIKDEGPFAIRVGVAQIFRQAWEDAKPEMLYIKLA